MDTTYFIGFSFQILSILLKFNLGGFSFHVSFSKRAVQKFVRKIGWLKIAVVDYDSTIIIIMVRIYFHTSIFISRRDRVWTNDHRGRTWILHKTYQMFNRVSQEWGFTSTFWQTRNADFPTFRQSMSQWLHTYAFGNDDQVKHQVNLLLVKMEAEVEFFSK